MATRSRRSGRRAGVEGLADSVDVRDEEADRPLPCRRARALVRSSCSRDVVARASLFFRLPRRLELAALVVLQAAEARAQASGGRPWSSTRRAWQCVSWSHVRPGTLSSWFAASVGPREGPGASNRRPPATTARAFSFRNENVSHATRSRLEAGIGTRRGRREGRKGRRDGGTERRGEAGRKREAKAGGERLDDSYSSTRSTARKASCGMSTRPTRFIRFFPSFCFSSSLRFRLMSPP